MIYSIWNSRSVAPGKTKHLMRFTVLAEVRAYWEGLREGDQLPRREAVDPRGFARALESVFMAERIGPGLARFRIAGMKINDLCGTEVRGLPLSLLFAQEARAQFAATLERVFAEPSIAEVAVEGERGIGRPLLDGRILLLPLLGARGVPDLCLGCLALEGEKGRVPRRFTIRASAEMAAAPNDSAFVEAASPFTTQFRAAKPYLRLVP